MLPFRFDHVALSLDNIGPMAVHSPIPRTEQAMDVQDIQPEIMID